VQKVILDRVNKPSPEVVALVAGQATQEQPAPSQPVEASKPATEAPEPPPRKFSRPASFDPHEQLLSKGLRQPAHPHSGAVYPTKQLAESTQPGYVDAGLSEAGELEVFQQFTDRLRSSAV